MEIVLYIQKCVYENGQIFQKYHTAYFGLCKFSNNGDLFSNDAVFSGHPVDR